MAHAYCILDNQGYKRTLRICNSYFISIATVVTLMRLSVTLYCITRIVLNSYLHTGYSLFLCAVFFHSDLGLDGRIILKRFVKKENGTALTGLMWLRTGTIEGACECGNGPSGSIKCGEFLD